jgi:ribosome-associated translation inhibitor RaiA
MEVYVHTVHLHADQEAIRAEVATALERFSDRLTRVEVYVSDVNGKKGGVDKRCLLEARPRGLKPVAAEDVAADAQGAVEGAVGKLERLLEHHFGRLEDRHS